MLAELSPLAADPVRLSALLAATAWGAGAAGLLVAPRSLPVRLGWLAGWFAALAHVAVALHVAHHWSHADVLRHAEEVAGFGPGVYANAPFLVAWLADALARLRHPAGPPRRWALAAHGFLAFIVFNATVVYGSWPARGLGVALFAGLGVLAWHVKAKARATPPPGPLPEAERGRQTASDSVRRIGSEPP